MPTRSPSSATPGAVVTSVPVSLSSGGSVSGAGVSCRTLSVGSEGVALGDEELAGGVGNSTQGIDARSTCPADHVVVGIAGTNAHGSNVDSLQVYCRSLNADGTLGETVVPGNSVGKTEDARGSVPVPPGRRGHRLPRAGRRQLLRVRPPQLRPALPGPRLPEHRPEDINLTWPTALTVGANSTTTSAITATGQDRWYRFPVQPGSSGHASTCPTCRRTTTSTLFKDIAQAFTTLTSTERPGKLSAEFAGDAYAPSVFSPSVFSPSVFSPSVFSPSVFSPSVFCPSVFSPSVFSPVGVLAVGVQPVGVLAVGVLALGLQSRRLCRRCSARRCSRRRCSRRRCSPRPSPARRPAA